MPIVNYFCGKIAVVMFGNIGKNDFAVALAVPLFLWLGLWRLVVGNRVYTFDMQIIPFGGGA